MSAKKLRKLSLELTEMIHRRQGIIQDDELTEGYIKHLERKIDEINIRRWNAVNNYLKEQK